jgi:hypothetical protein
VPSNANQAWNLESFLDSLIVELDRAQDTLSLKGITRRLTYTVKDVGLDLQIFPQYDGRKVKFVTAQPGDAGASKISIQLGSITDRQIKETTNDPPSKDDIVLDDVDGLDDGTKDSLRKLGVNSAGDLERIERKNVDVETIVKARPSSGEVKPGVDYGNLARLIQRAKRTRQFAPRVLGVDLETDGGRPVLAVHGRNLALDDAPRTGGWAMTLAERQGFPSAVLDDQPLEVLSATESTLRLGLPRMLESGERRLLKVALDPYALISLEIKP